MTINCNFSLKISSNRRAMWIKRRYLGAQSETVGEKVKYSKIPPVDEEERRDVMHWFLWKQAMKQTFGCKILREVHTCVMSWIVSWTPATCKYDLIWKWSLCQCHPVKMRSWGWALMQCDWCPYKKRKMLCEDRHTGRTLSDDRTHAATSQGIPRPSGPHQKQVEAGKDFTQSLRGSMAPLSPSLWTSRFQNRERINFCHVEAHMWRQIEPVKGGGREHSWASRGRSQAPMQDPWSQPNLVESCLLIQSRTWATPGRPSPGWGGSSQRQTLTELIGKRRFS